MTRPIRPLPFLAVLALITTGPLTAQRPQGRPIGKVTTIGNLIHIEVNEGVLAPEHLFDLDKRTLRFTPQPGGYRVENLPLRWDPEFGPALQGSTVSLRNLRIPFSGKTWSAFNVGSGQITFDAPQGSAGGAGGRGGLVMERYAMMQTVGTTLINMVPGIAAFARVRWDGPRHAKELADRVVVTWTLNEGNAGIQAFSWTPTTNRIQAVLHGNGAIELSYDGVNAKDGVVGIFPLVSGGVKKRLATLADAEDAAVPAHLDIRAVHLDVIDGLFLEATITTRGAPPAPGNAAMNGVSYRVGFENRAVWTINGNTGGNAPVAYTASGRGVYPQVTVAGNSITVRGVLPGTLANAASVQLFATASSPPAAGMGMPGPVADDIAARAVTLGGDVRSPEVDFSSVSANTTLPVIYEPFHWSSIPNSTDVACTVIQSLGDRFDFIASYSDFRVDNPEGGTPSSGPRSGNVTGIGSDTRDPGAFCTRQLQSMFNQPVSTSAVQIQERSPTGHMTEYSYAMSQIGHELGHRWAARMFALVNGERIELGPTHWTSGLNLPSAFPYTKPIEADAMGGSVWMELGSGRWAQVDRDFYWPTKGFSWFALYLMGLARPDEVPAKDFFLLRNLQRTGQSTSEGYPIFTGEKLQLTMDQVIAAMGPRRPAFEQQPKNFRTAIVIMTLPGKQPTPELIQHANAISERWVRYWTRVTGGRATMSISPR